MIDSLNLSACPVYHAYGLALYSEIDLQPNVIRAAAAAAGSRGRVVITEGDVPSTLSDSTFVNRRVQATDGTCLLTIPGVARFAIAHGHSIRVQPLPDVPLATVRRYLLGSALAALLMQRGDHPLHGSASLVEGGAVVFLGDSGAGKSTLATALEQTGLPLLSDDVAVLRSGTLRVQAGTGTAKLWPQSSAALALPATGTRLSPLHEKRAYVCRANLLKEFPLKRIYLLVPGPAEAPTVTEVEASERPLLLLRQTYRRYLLKAIGAPQHHFQRVVSVSQAVPMFRLHRPDVPIGQPGAISAIVDLVRRHMEG